MSKENFSSKITYPNLDFQNLEQIKKNILNLLVENEEKIKNFISKSNKKINLLGIKVDNEIIHIQSLLRTFHVADIADFLEVLQYDMRLLLWNLIDNNIRGKILLEVSTLTLESLLKNMSDSELVKIIKNLHVDEQAYVIETLPHRTTNRLLTCLDPTFKNQISRVLQYSKESIGQMMDFEFITVRKNVTLKVVQRYLRRYGNIPESTDKIFVVDSENRLQGELLLTSILTNSLKKTVAEVMKEVKVKFFPNENIEDAAGAFERYDLISAAVVNGNGCLIGRLTIEDIVDNLHEESDTNIRRMGGLSPEEDLFAPIWQSVKTRWAWLAINLCTAFMASRVIGIFESTISQLVALATLMPIVAGIGGNTGNQTITMIVRSIALRQIQIGNFSFLLLRELKIAFINGIIWGGVLGIITSFLYNGVGIGAVMMSAVVLNLMIAALMGVLIPLIMVKLKRDPAIGSSVIITAITDTGGFFLFLGLGSIFLL